jgi:hypothetical protein
MIRRIAYEAATRERVRYVHGGKTYAYFEVPKWGMSASCARSKGRFFNDCIKNEYGFG